MNMTIFYVAIGVLCVGYVVLSYFYGKLLRKYKNSVSDYCELRNIVSEETEMLRQKAEDSYKTTCQYAYLLEAVQGCVDGYRIWEGPRGFSVMAIHDAEGTISEQLSTVKYYPFDENDPESKDFALRNAEELVEILKREVV